MRTKSMMAKAQAKKKKRREGKKMPVVREPEPFEFEQLRIIERLKKRAGPNASPRDLVMAIQAISRTNREWEEAHEYLYD
jgi:translation initiation factor 1 (eIF-1/SUI1)